VTYLFIEYKQKKRKDEKERELIINFISSAVYDVAPSSNLLLEMAPHG